MNSLSLTRREFLQTTAAGATAAITHLTPSLLWGQATPPIASEPIPAWASKPQRWAQLTLVEDDPVHFDPAFWLDYFQRTRSDGVCLSGGGCVAYYPTEVPFHHRSAWLDNRDVLGELVTGCRKLSMSVLIRTDPHATYDDARAAHPDWIAVDAEGNPRRHWSSPEMWVTCALGPYNFEFMTAVHHEIMSRYHPDGLFLNRWDGSGDCYCVHCRENFKAATGLDLPRTTNPQDPARRAYILWRQQRLIAVIDTWNTEIRKTNPEAASSPTTAAAPTIPSTPSKPRRRAPMLAADRQARRGLNRPWLMGKTAKEYRATMGNKPVIGLFGVGLEEPYRWKDSVNAAAEIRIWALDGIANGMRPWFSKFSATLHDERWLNGVDDLYLWAANNQPYLRHQTPLARVALVYSQQTALVLRRRPATPAKVEDHALGWYQALIESRIPFEMVHDHNLDAAHLAPFKTLILPNIAALSDAQCDQLRAFVKSGGSLIATSRDQPLRRAGRPPQELRPRRSLRRRLHQPAARRPDAQLLPPPRARSPPAPHRLHRPRRRAPHHQRRLPPRRHPREHFAETPITLIPSYPDLPMEKVYPRTPKTDISCLYLRQPARPRRLLPLRHRPHLLGSPRRRPPQAPPQHRPLGQQRSPAIEVIGPGLLDVTVWRNPASITIHLVNLTNPMAMKGPYRDFFPIGAQTIKLRLPAGVHAKQARLLVAEKATPIARSGQTILILNVPTILDHEVVAIDI